jgi:hypothetical protein
MAEQLAQSVMLCGRGNMRRQLGFIFAATAWAGCALYSLPARADQGGVSFWLPGQFGSLAAAPQTPGWSFATIYYHTTVSAGGEVSAAREATIGRFNRTINIDLNASLKTHADLVFLSSNYVFAAPVLGAQLAIGLTGAGGHNDTSIRGTLTASVGPLSITRSGIISDERFGFADLYPMASLRWNAGVHNFMVYGTGDVPIGTYNSDRLSNFGIGHGAIDGGIGYTYLNPQTGHELSFVTGLTYNFENQSTDYQNGIDWHLDWGASQFLSKQLFVGAVGYFYQQLTADKGQPAILGDFKSRVIGVGPQIGYIFPVGDLQGFASVKGYWEFASENRPEGWNLWVTFAFSPQAPTTSAQPPLVRKF